MNVSPMTHLILLQRCMWGSYKCVDIRCRLLVFFLLLQLVSMKKDRTIDDYMSSSLSFFIQLVKPKLTVQAADI